MKQARRFLKNLFHIIGEPYMRVLPGQLAFFTVLSLIPLIAIIILIAGSFSISVNEFFNIEKYLPTNLSNIAINSVVGKTVTFNLIIFFITAFFLASNGAHSVIITSNEIHGIKGRGYIGRRLKAILITLLLVGIILFTLIVPVFGNTIINGLKETFGNNQAVKISEYIFKILNIPITMIIMFYLVKIIYNIAPDEKIIKEHNNIGPLFTTIMWIIGTEIYSIYVKFFANYNIFYGSISNIIILMIWVYFLSYIFVIGMALDIKEEQTTE